VVAFEGWNDAGEAASGAVETLKGLLNLYPIAEIDSERYFDFQFNRPTVTHDEDGERLLIWPSVITYGPVSLRPRHEQPLPLREQSDRAVQSDQTAHSDQAAQDDQAAHSDRAAHSDQTAHSDRAAHSDQTAHSDRAAQDDAPAITGANAAGIHLLLGTEPSRNWRSFTEEIMQTITENGITGVIFLGAMLADVPHTRPISVFVGSDNAAVRRELGVERSLYEGPVGILSVLGDAVERAGIPTVSVWASVPHYVHNAPSPKATLAIVEKLEEIMDVVIPRGDLPDESVAWETGIDALASDDEEMASYISQLEQARDTVDSPEASGEAIAREFERYLRRRDGWADGRGDGRGGGPTP